MRLKLALHQSQAPPVQMRVQAAQTLAPAAQNLLPAAQMEPLAAARQRKWRAPMMRQGQQFQERHQMRRLRRVLLQGHHQTRKPAPMLLPGQLLALHQMRRQAQMLLQGQEPPLLHQKREPVQTSLRAFLLSCRQTRRPAWRLLRELPRQERHQKRRPAWKLLLVLARQECHQGRRLPRMLQLALLLSRHQMKRQALNLLLALTLMEPRRTRRMVQTMLLRYLHTTTSTCQNIGKQQAEAVPCSPAQQAHNTHDMSYPRLVPAGRSLLPPL